MKITNDTYDADEGEIYFEGRLIGKHTVQDTINMGIAMIHQELNPVMNMTIAEDDFLGREPVLGCFVDFNRLYKETQSVLDDLRAPCSARQTMVFRYRFPQPILRVNAATIYYGVFLKPVTQYTVKYDEPTQRNRRVQKRKSCETTLQSDEVIQTL